MERGFTRDPSVALSGLISMAMVGVIIIGAGSVAVGLIEGSWIRVVGGSVLLVGLSWMVRQAGQVVRRALQTPFRKGHGPG